MSIWPASGRPLPLLLPASMLVNDAQTSQSSSLQDWCFFHRSAVLRSLSTCSIPAQSTVEAVHIVATPPRGQKPAKPAVVAAHSFCPHPYIVHCTDPSPQSVGACSFQHDCLCTTCPHLSKYEGCAAGGVTFGDLQPELEDACEMLELPVDKCPKPPFAMITSNKYRHINDELQPVRQYPWGECVVTDPKYSDLSFLKYAPTYSMVSPASQCKLAACSPSRCIANYTAPADSDNGLSLLPGRMPVDKSTQHTSEA